MRLKRLQHRWAAVDATRRHLDAKGDPEQRRGRVNATNENSKKPTGNDQMTIGLVSDLYVSLGSPKLSYDR